VAVVEDQTEEDPTSGTLLSVVIPTTHRVAAVLDLVRQIRATTPVPTSITVVDNGPSATQGGWETLDGKLIVREVFLGSEQAFALGLSCAPTAKWYLLLDHDARLSEDSLSTLLGSASDGNAVYSANQDGEGISWDRRNGRTPGPRDLSPALIPVEFAPWSGLLLNPTAAGIVSSLNSGFFFYWDDYLACWALRRAGLRIWGVPAAVVGNERLPNDWLSPWRAYYNARNHILFHRQTGSGGRVELILVRGKDLVMASFGKRRLERVRAIARGICDGLADRRGPLMVPT